MQHAHRSGKMGQRLQALLPQAALMGQTHTSHIWPMHLSDQGSKVLLHFSCRIHEIQDTWMVTCLHCSRTACLASGTNFRSALAPQQAYSAEVSSPNLLHLLCYQS